MDAGPVDDDQDDRQARPRVEDVVPECASEGCLVVLSDVPAEVEAATTAEAWRYEGAAGPRAGTSPQEATNPERVSWALDRPLIDELLVRGEQGLSGGVAVRDETQDQPQLPFVVGGGRLREWPWPGAALLAPAHEEAHGKLVRRIRQGS